MEAEHWTAITVAAISAVAILIPGLYGKRPRKPPKERAQEDRAHDAISTPASPGSGAHDVQAIRLAQQAMDQVASLSDKLCSTEARLGEVEKELGVFRRSYNALYWWAMGIINDWDDVREDPNPRPLPQGIHHPE